MPSGQSLIGCEHCHRVRNLDARLRSLRAHPPPPPHHPKVHPGEHRHCSIMQAIRGRSSSLGPRTTCPRRRPQPAATRHADDAIVDGNAPATARAIASARWRKPPLQLMPSSVTFSSVTDTETPSGAIDRLMCSANADLIRTSMSLLARRSALRHDRASGSFRRVRQWYSCRSRASLTPKPSLGPLHPTTLAA